MIHSFIPIIETGFELEEDKERTGKSGQIESLGIKRKIRREFYTTFLIPLFYDLTM